MTKYGLQSIPIHCILTYRNWISASDIKINISCAVPAKAVRAGLPRSARLVKFLQLLATESQKKISCAVPAKAVRAGLPRSARLEQKNPNKILSCAVPAKAGTCWTAAQRAAGRYDKFI